MEVRIATIDDIDDLFELNVCFENDITFELTAFTSLYYRRCFE